MIKKRITGSKIRRFFSRSRDRFSGHADVMQEINTFILLLDFIRQTPLAPIIDFLDCATGFYDPVLDLLKCLAGCFIIQIGMDNHHQFIIVHAGFLLSMGLPPDLNGC